MGSSSARRPASGRAKTSRCRTDFAAMTSIDGYGTGNGQSLQAPFGHRERVRTGGSSLRERSGRCKGNQGAPPGSTTSSRARGRRASEPKSWDVTSSDRIGWGVVAHLRDVLDVCALDALIAEGYITRRTLAGSWISVYNYTAKAAYKGVWTPETRRCRGLVVGEGGRILARPFEKFFDLSKTDEVPTSGPIEVSEKWDGSLGILYERADGWAITTRGDPNSWQSEVATILFRERHERFAPPDGVTLLFEIVLAENHIVVDYGGLRELVLLAAIDIETGRDVELPGDWPGAVAERQDASGGRLECLFAEAEATGNREGFVVRWPESGLRAKVKFGEYRQRHRMIFCTSTKTVWETLAAGLDPSEGLGREAELAAWVNAEADALKEAQRSVMQEAWLTVGSLEAAELAERREAAARIKASRYPAVAFNLLDGRVERAAEAAWRIVRPGTTRFFRDQPDDDV